MARKKDAQSKSQAVRDAFTKLGPTASARQVMDHLKEQGTEVTQGLVYQVKNKMGMSKKRRGRRRGRPPGRPAGTNASAAPTFSLAHILAAKAFVKDCGGFARAKVALSALESLI